MQKVHVRVRAQRCAPERPGMGVDLQCPTATKGEPMTSNHQANQVDASHSRRVRDRIQTVTGDTFQALVLDGSGPIAVEFMSYGCGFCRALEPSLQQAAETLRTTEQVVRVNVAVETDLAESYAIQGTPTIVLFLEGREVGRIEGPPPSSAALVDALSAPFASHTGEDS
jgi:thioredoxin-like negative regulator of GroEL